MRSTQPFFYSDLRDDRILAEHPRHIHVTGGRGLGKTRLLREVVDEHARRKRSGRRFFIDGRADDVEVNLRKLTAEPLGGDDLVAIDDYDRCATPEAEKSLSGLVLPSAGAARLRPRVVVATHASPELFEIPVSSILTTQFQHVQLEPWSGDWRRAFHGHLGELDACWGEILLEVTGGHPALLGPTIAHLSGPGRASVKLLFKAEQGARLRFIENVVLGAGGATIVTAIDGLRRQHPDAHALLVRLARAERGAGEEPDLLLRARLLHEGLAYLEPATQSLRVPGTIIQRLAIASAPSPAPSPAPSQEAPSPARSSERPRAFAVRWEQGVLHVAPGPGRPAAEVHFSPTAWQVVAALLEAGGKIVPLHELAARAKMKSETTIRSSLQRIAAKIEQAGAAGLLENVHGQGYRMNI